MGKYFLAKVNGKRVQENGVVARITDTYLVDAMTFTEAEARVVAEAEPFMQDMDVKSITRTKYVDVIRDKYNIESSADALAKKALGQNNNMSGVADKFFKCKVNLVTMDEKTAKEKKTGVLYCVNAGSSRAAHDLVDVFMKGTMCDYEVANITETPILDVIEHTTEEPLNANDNDK